MENPYTEFREILRQIATLASPVEQARALSRLDDWTARAASYAAIHNAGYSNARILHNLACGAYMAAYQDGVRADFWA